MMFLRVVISSALVSVRGLDLGGDFVGGQSVHVEFTENMPEIEDIREAVGTIGLGDATIQQFGSDQAVSIRTALPDGDEAAAERVANPLVDVIRQAFPTEHAGQVETVSGKVSEALRRTGAVRLALSL